MPRKSSDILTPAEVAALFRVSTDTVRRWAETGNISHFLTPSGRLRFRRSDVEAFTKPVEKAAS